MHKDFWQKPFLMLQQNLRKIDAKGIGSNKLAKQLIDEIDDYGGNAILANAGGDRSMVSNGAVLSETK